MTPAGVDGFLVRKAGGLHFLAPDPNVRVTGTVPPWSVEVALSETAGRGLMGDLLKPWRTDRGGMFPSVIGRPSSST